VSSKDLEVRERLNRPVIKVMQRHPGTQRHPGNQMPEAQYIVQVRMLYDLVIDRPTCVVYRRLILTVIITAKITAVWVPSPNFSPLLSTLGIS